MIESAQPGGYVSARQWCKRLNKSAEEIEAAVAKVGNNAETVIKELRD